MSQSRSTDGLIYKGNNQSPVNVTPPRWNTSSRSSEQLRRCRCRRRRPNAVTVSPAARCKMGWAMPRCCCCKHAIVPFQGIRENSSADQYEKVRFFFFSTACMDHKPPCSGFALHGTFCTDNARLLLTQSPVGGGRYASGHGYRYTEKREKKFPDLYATRTKHTISHVARASVTASLGET